MTISIDLAEVARQHLPADVAQRWIALLRPAIRLYNDDIGCGPSVGYLGGDPQLPPDVAWPTWPGEGPLNFVASLDCARLPRLPNLPLPTHGSLLFFYYDGPQPNREAVVLTSDPETQAGARVLYTPASAATTRRRAPRSAITYRHTPLYAATVDTAPSHDHFIVQDAFPDMDVDHPVSADDFLDALDLPFHFGHQMGGHALPIQGPVEYEVAQAALGGVDWRSPQLADEAQRWQLLAQFTSDPQANMMWGDAGTLYWLIKPEDLAAERFNQALFTWQCS